MNDTTPHRQDAIAAWLDDWLQTEFTFILVGELSAQLAAMPRRDQDFLLDWTQRITSTNIQIAYEFAESAAKLIGHTDRHLLETWAIHAMDTYDRSGLMPALTVIRDIQRFVQFKHEQAVGVVLDDVRGVLLRFVHGLSGRRLKIEEGARIYTDSETLYLPPVMAELMSEKDNFTYAKAAVTMMWAQTRFGSFNDDDIASVLSLYPQQEKALRWFHALESVRLEACLQRELPGLFRQMTHLKSLQDTPDTLTVTQDAPQALATVLTQLQNEAARLSDSVSLLAQVYDWPEPVLPCYCGELDLAAVAKCRATRVEKEKILLRVKLADLAKEQQKQERESSKPKQFEVKNPPQQEQQQLPADWELTLDSMPVAPPEGVKQLLTSIFLDFGEIPPEYLVPAGDGEYDPALYRDQDADPDDVWQGTYHEEGADLYPEWDFGRRHYRKNWCTMREKDVKPVYDEFYRATLSKYGDLVRQLRRTFEAMRDEDRLLKRQTDGDDVDIDALVEALADSHAGQEMTPNLFTRMHRSERNIAVLFMVDMSGSTKGWINDAERESLILLSEALEILGDRYGIYGFSGMTRKRCELFRIKRLDEPYNAEVKARISGIRPQDYTRMGFAIRHLSKMLRESEASTKILITLSDGKPDDYNDYRGVYGIEDTRRALIEARRDGIHPYCITIDEKARDYLPHLYGPAAFTLIDEVRQLPFKVSDIYRRLTT